jgi:hypothetical protein
VTLLYTVISRPEVVSPQGTFNYLKESSQNAFLKQSIVGSFSFRKKKYIFHRVFSKEESVSKKSWQAKTQLVNICLEQEKLILSILCSHI